MSFENPFDPRTTAVRIDGVSKCYHIYAKPRDRLLQFVMPRIAAMTGREPPTYGKVFWALQDISFELARGETFGVIGRNGAGKSTLLQILCGTLMPTAGDVQVAGRVAALLELGAGFDPEYTGRENIFLNGSLLGLSRDEIETSYDDIAAFADIGDFLEQPVKIYSSGMYVRLAFAISSFVSPEILIVDEALAVGDFNFNLKCLRRLDQLRDDGCTIIFVSHDIALVQKICSRAAYLRNGSMAMLGHSAAVTSRYIGDLTESVDRKPSGSAVPALAGQENSTSPQAQASVARLPDWPGAVERERFRSQLTGTESGSLELEIVYARLVHDGSGGMPSFGDTIEVAVYLRVVESVSDLALSLYVIDEKGQLLIGCNSHEEGDDFPALASGEHCRVVFRFQNRLRDGVFGITLIASRYLSASNNSYLHYLEPALTFHSVGQAGRSRWAMYSPPFEVLLETEGGDSENDASV